MIQRKSIVEMTASFERWLGGQMKIVRADLLTKHKNMAGNVFLFLRATFYAWIVRVFEELPELCDAPVVTSVADLHVDQFSTWRDFDGRLNWGVADYDEAYPLPFTCDLVRLATSAKFALAEGDPNLSTKDACEAILAGYTATLKSGGEPIVLADQNAEMRRMMTARLKNPSNFWKALSSQLKRCKTVPEGAAKAIANELPEGDVKLTYGQRTAGQGSLGRPRIVGMSFYKGGDIAREAKAQVPSACVWAQLERQFGLGSASANYQKELIASSVHNQDPFLDVHEGWVVRRLSPDCSRLELGDLPRNRDEKLLLYMMGVETANIHLATEGAAPAILAYLKTKPKDWLVDAAKKMAKVTRQDQRDWGLHFETVKK